MEPSKYCDSKNEEKLYSYRTEGFFNTKIPPSATAQYHSTYWRTVIPDSTWDSIIFPIPGANRKNGKEARSDSLLESTGFPDVASACHSIRRYG